MLVIVFLISRLTISLNGQILNHRNNKLRGSKGRKKEKEKETRDYNGGERQDAGWQNKKQRRADQSVVVLVPT